MEKIEYVQYALSFPGTYIDYPFGVDTLVVRAYQKMFMLVFFKNNELYISLKCDPSLAASIREEFDYIIPGWHLNKKHWNSVIMSEKVDIENLKWLIEHSYACVINKLPKKQREELVNHGNHSQNNSIKK